MCRLVILYLVCRFENPKECGRSLTLPPLPLRESLSETDVPPIAIHLCMCVCVCALGLGLRRRKHSQA